MIANVATWCRWPMGKTEANTHPVPNVARRTADRSAAANGLFGARGGWVDRSSSIPVVALLSALLPSAAALADGCKLHKFAEFPVTMAGMRPLMTANINDVDVQFVVDSGAFYSLMSPGSAAALKLKRLPVPIDYSFVTGINGAAGVSLARVKTFTLADVALHDVEFLVGGTETGNGSVGLLGQNFLHIADVEYDLGQGMIRLMKTEDCSKALLAYWAGASTPYSVISITQERALSSQSTSSRIAPKPLEVSRTIGRAYVNGVEIRVLFDTGAWASFLSLNAAARAGIKPDSPGVVSQGQTIGTGRNSVATYVAPFSSFKIGEEEIKNTRLRIGDFDLRDADMLLGVDFFLSHRIYVANSQNKLYFTYNGGRVFNLTAGQRPVSEAAADAAPKEPSNAATATATTEDAADYGRRGAAFTSRREFDQALVALTRACELAPDNSEYLYLRGMVYWHMSQPAPAKADFDRALKLKPDDLRALIARAQLSLQRGDKVAAGADLDAADTIAPKEADLRFQMASAYQSADRLASAVAQLTLWIESHENDAKLPSALNSRCWARALDGVDLPLALKDCNAALKRVAKSNPLYSEVADSRGLVYLRMGNYDQSITDYDASLKIDDKNAWALYGRGIDKLRKQDTTAGDADIGRAKALSPQVAEEFKRRGIIP